MGLQDGLGGVEDEVVDNVAVDEEREEHDNQGHHHHLASAQADIHDPTSNRK